MSNSPTGASIVVPAYREAPNLTALVERTFAALAKAGVEAEMIVVDDDSRDGTDTIVARLARHHPVRLITRRNERGLAGAVLRGFQEAKYDLLVVLDADLQHPPELIPELLEPLKSEDCDFVIATRYSPTGSVAGDWPAARRFASWVAGLFARPLVPMSDPLSGFFALRKEKWKQASSLDPIGFKIALELYIKCGCRSFVEVPIRFSARSAGTSKFSAMESLRYLRHLRRLYRYRFPRLAVMLWVVGFVALTIVLLTVVFGIG